MREWGEKTEKKTGEEINKESKAKKQKKKTYILFNTIEILSTYHLTDGQTNEKNKSNKAADVKQTNMCVYNRTTIISHAWGFFMLKN